MTIDVANKRSLVAPWLALAAAVPLTALVAVMLDRRLSNDGHGEHGAHEEQPESEKRRDEHGGDRVKLSDEGRKNAGIEMGKAGPGNVSITLALP
ncbi:MAG: hypothetical protein JNK04_23815, partial [Myxococcales bacterium]|nr:hypothetical protein [Myxococcales bacterium]